PAHRRWPPGPRRSGAWPASPGGAHHTAPGRASPPPTPEGEDLHAGVLMKDIKEVKDALRTQRIETPSWAYGNSGTRFKVFPQPGVPRDPYEKIADAAQVHRFTGIAPTVALHIPWDKVDDYADLARHAREHGVEIGASNSNVFQDDDYKLGSVTNPNPGWAAMARTTIPNAATFWASTDRTYRMMVSAEA